MTDPYRVVVVEDDLDVAEYTRTVLEKRGGCIVRTTADPFTARALISEFQPDVVVTDIEMPGMTGLQLMEQIRADQPDLPIIVMTAHVSVDYAVAALRAQADEFLTKPVGAIDLVKVVQRLAADGRASRAVAGPREHVLAVGAHPDDVEIGVGGILAAHRAAGDSVTVLTLSRGGRGGSPDDRQHESLASAELLGARLFLEDLVDTEIANTGPTVALIDCFRSQADIRGYLDPEFVLATARYWGRYGGGTSVEPLEILRETADMSSPVRPMSTGAESALRGRPQ